MRRTVRRTAVLVVAGVLAVLVVAFGVAGARPLARSVPTVSDERQREVAAAAREFGVPEPVLLAVSAALTGWGATGDPGVPGDAGLFALTDRAPALDGRGTGALPAADEDPAVRTLGAAAALLRLPPERVRSSPADAARGAAALLRQYALDAGGGRLPAALPGWYGAVARFGTGDAMTGRAFADDVFALLRTGVPATVVHSQRFALPARPDAVLPPAPGTGRGFGAAAPAQCPAGLSCRFVPAAGYDPAERPAGSLRTAVVSDAPAGYTATVVAAVRASSAWSPHYVVRASDGAVTQTVRLEDVAWHSGDPTVNAASVGIAVERGPGGPSPAAYRSVGRLLRWLAAGGGPPLDRAHLLGAGEVSGAPVPLDAAWDWGRVLAGAGAPLRARAFRADRVVTVAAPGLVLRAEPAEDAPALAARPAVGRSMAVAERRGDWTAVWYGGRTGWFRDPGGTATLPGDAERVIPVPGRDGVPVYGTVSGAAPKALPERALAGQAYVLLDTAAVQAPSGAYLPIGFGDRVGFVRADDVRLDGLG